MMHVIKRMVNVIFKWIDYIRIPDLMYNNLYQKRPLF